MTNYIQMQVGSGWAVEGIKKEGRRLIAMDKSRDEASSQWWFAAPKDFLGGDAARECFVLPTTFDRVADSDLDVTCLVTIL